jgi:DNA modification methylase
MAGRTVAWSSDGTRGRVLPFRVPFADWSRHPSPFDWWTMRRAIGAAQIPPDGLVVDPFAGTATLGAVLSARGDRFIGIEAHPFTAKAAALKFERPEVAEDLLEATEWLIDAGRKRKAADVASEHHLLQRTIDPRALAVLAGLRDAAATAGPWSAHLQCAVLAALRHITGSRWPHVRQAPVDPAGHAIALVARHAERMAHDLAAAPRFPRSVVVAGDAREATPWSCIEPQSVDVCITSPPYLNQVAYAEDPRIEMYFLGVANDWGDLRAHGRALVRSCVQQVTTRDVSEAWARLEAVPSVRDRLEGLSAKLLKAGSDRAQPKRYDRLLPVYFSDLLRVFEQLRRVLRPDASVALVIGDSCPYGVRLDVPSLTGLLAGTISFELAADVVVGTRGHKWQGIRTRHSEVLLDRMLVLRNVCGYSVPACRNRSAMSSTHFVRESGVE